MEEIGSKIPVDSLLFGVRMFVISYAQYRWDLLHRHLYKTLPSAGFCRICGRYKILQKKPGQSHFLKTKKAANKINKKPTISFHFSPSLR